ncbi:MAG: aminotransferase class I/II-fold pyridoxal phosphate-dependent enzyme [Planctomycetota bacterium]|nr:aminotransferase class I/II-fold pyridoxal phosphate-dependent enzyme [Planctomycetota bacterium]MDI6788082.1 aminotransferase class I/II-fold pyridoxal phosphate-dependent enzyme [Planctomycetota bacterium]
MNISNGVKPREIIQKMVAYNHPGDDRESFLRLDFNENTIGPPRSIISAIQRGLSKEPLSVYPDYNRLLTLLSKHTGLPSDYILPVNGTDEAVKCIMDAYLDKGDELLIPTPTFVMYKLYGTIREAKIREIPFLPTLSPCGRGQGEGRIGRSPTNFPLKEFLNAINSRTRVIAIANPNNPTGTLLGKNDLLKIIERARNAIVLIDEAYYHFSGLTIKPFVKKYSNLIVTRTFSKACGLAGLRLGYILSHPENIETLRKVRPPYSVNRVSCIAAEALLKSPASDRYVKQYAGEITRSRILFQGFLKRWKIPAFKSSANFVMARFGFFSAGIVRALKEEGILVKQIMPEWLRIGVGTVVQTRRLIHALGEILKRRTIIFDFDGVLMDVSRSYHYAIRDTVAHFSNRVIPLKLIDEMKAKGGYNDDWLLTYDILRRFGKTPDFKAVKRYFQSRYCGERFDGYICSEPWLFSRALLKRISRYYTLAIVTARPNKETDYALKKWKVRQFFHTIIARDNIPERYQKPHPAGIIRALEYTRAVDGIYLGDNPDDMVAGKRAGLTAIGILPPHNRSVRLSLALLSNGASIILPDINRIEQVL